MIEINLLPGASRKKKSSGGGFDVRALMTEWQGKVKDPYLISAVAGVAVGLGALAFMYLSQSRQEADLNARIEKAQTDSTRFAAVLREQMRTSAKRDSMSRQLRVIRAIDDNRFVWSHVMDEVSAALPAYTWLTSLDQISVVALPPAASAPREAGKPAAAAAAGADAKAKDKKKEAEVEEEAPLEFKIVGNTVDIQALTHFMKTLEGSAFVQNVRLLRSDLIVVDGKEVTQFELSGQYQKPDATAIRLVPLAETVR